MPTEEQLSPFGIRKESLRVYLVIFFALSISFMIYIYLRGKTDVIIIIKCWASVVPLTLILTFCIERALGAILSSILSVINNWKEKRAARKKDFMRTIDERIAYANAELLNKLEQEGYLKKLDTDLDNKIKDPPKED